MRHHFTRAVTLALTLLMLVGLLAGCTGTAKPAATEASQMNDEAYIIGVPTGAAAVNAVEGALPKAKLQYYDSLADAYLAVQQGKVDAFAFDRYLLNFAITNGLTGVKVLPDNVGVSVDVAVGISQNSDIPDLQQKINDCLATLGADGTLDEMFQRWIVNADDTMPDIPKPQHPTMTLKVGTSGTIQPFSYYKGTELTGYDLELSARLALLLNANLEIKVYDYGGFTSAAESGNIDCILANLNVTPERRETMDFSTPLYQTQTALLVQDDSAAANPLTNFWDGFKASFTRTFLTEDRWKLVLDGLGVTVFISVCSGIVGSVMGFGLCMLRRSKKRIAALPAAGFIKLIQGTPIVVLLMILYYIIFGEIDIPATLVAIFGFAVNFGVYVSEMMRTGIEAVDKGQIEAAYALGFTKTKTFWKITFPQAARHFLPIFKGEFISMVKMTSVVGYIAIQDLTKVSDIIRSRTLEAFFPLIATAIIYFLVANTLTMLLSRLEFRLDPKRRGRTVKGVVMK
ncbi:MAG: ABC transporter substrate-binding protein/permease [Oscillospiraceae bacterium]